MIDQLAPAFEVIVHIGYFVVVRRLTSDDDAVLEPIGPAAPLTY